MRNPLDVEIHPRIMEAFHLSQVALWLAMIPVVLVTSLKGSVPFLVLVSLLALVYSELSSWQASLSERRLDKTDDYGDGVFDSV
jgi:hypothetical protein